MADYSILLLELGKTRLSTIAMQRMILPDGWKSQPEPLSIADERIAKDSIVTKMKATGLKP